MTVCAEVFVRQWCGPDRPGGLKGYLGCLFSRPERAPPRWAESGVPREPSLTARASAQSKEGKVNKAFKGLIRQNPWAERRKCLIIHSCEFLLKRKKKVLPSLKELWKMCDKNTLRPCFCVTVLNDMSDFIRTKHTELMTNWITVMFCSDWVSTKFFTVTCF